MSRLTIRGKYIFDGPQKFFARGVSYGPFTPNSRGERYPEPERAEADFRMIRELGANLVRTYVPPPPWMFELAGKHDLRLMVGMPWPFHMAFLDSAAMMNDIRATITEGVRTMKQWGDVIFAYSLGNEIRSDIVRWHGPQAVTRFLRELYDSGKQLDPEGLFTFSNYPSAEYLDLNFLEIVCFNVYLHREPDFRRYLTHLLATTADRPLLLSETGMDTIREGEAHQAELLRWQARAAFELGLSGFIVFAFTDEWHTGGAEITDWAFGLVTRERQPKLAFEAVGEVFRSPLPPPLPELPPASVVVCAYNAAATLQKCLDSLKKLNYPTYEVIVVDDGSNDATAQIAENFGARVIRIEHQGLSAARNAGLANATHPIVAFIDADAEADRDWLYHLVETMRRKQTSAAGGRNFFTQGGSAIERAIALAPGAPREVRAGDDELDQVCGCSMVIDKAALPSPRPFDQMFVTAGDDVDFSWSARERGDKLAYAAGATVIHSPRTSIRAYLRQQIGYGRAEALLARKYPDRVGGRDGIYGNPSWLARWFGTGPRVYYGAFGRGLFQSLYRGADLPLIRQIPLTFSWVLFALLLLIFGCFVSVGLVIVGAISLILTLTSAISLTRAQIATAHPTAGEVWRLFILCLMGPLARSYARDLLERSSALRIDNELRGYQPRFHREGAIALPGVAPEDDELIERLIDPLRRALLKRGVAVALTDGYQSYDLQVRTDDGVAADVNLLNSRDGRVQAGWKLGLYLPIFFRRVVILVIALILLLAANENYLALAVLIIGGAGITGSLILDARRIPALMELAVRDLDAPAVEVGSVS